MDITLWTFENPRLSVHAWSRWRERVGDRSLSAVIGAAHDDRRARARGRVESDVLISPRICGCAVQIGLGLGLLLLLRLVEVVGVQKVGEFFISCKEKQD